MLSVLLIVQENEIKDALVDEINKSAVKFEIAGITKGVNESIRWFNRHEPPDLIVSAGQFSDGSCYDIVRQCNLYCPVLLLPTEDTPFYDSPFQQGPAAYLTKPPSLSKVIRALEKFQSTREPLLADNVVTFDVSNEFTRKKSRIIIKKGKEFRPVNLQDVVLIYFENGLVFLLTNDNKKHIVDADGLNLVYNNMDRSVFYRANRKFIFNINYLNNYKSVGNNRILVELSINTPEEIIISQYRANEFRAWIENLSINSGHVTM